MRGWHSARAPWLEIMGKNAFRDPKGRHVRIYCDLLDSPAWFALSKTSRALFLDLRSFLGPNNNGDISAALSLLKIKGWNSSSTLSEALFELQALGFIAKTRDTVGVEHGSRVCCLYRFTDLPTYQFPKLGIEAQLETHDYREHTSVAAAEQALRKAQTVREAKARAGREAIERKKSALREAKRIGSKTESQKAEIASDSEHCTRPSVRNLKAVKTA
jgi:hypothetical protein